MKKLFLIVIFLTLTGVVSAAPVDNPNPSKNKAQALSESFVPVPFESLGSLPTQYNGTVVYCPDCGTAVVCSGGGGPALALAINGAWNCQALSNTNSGGGGGGSVSPLTATLDAAAHWIINIGKLTGNGIIQYANNATNALLGFSINGTYNPVAYGADPTGATDSTPAEQTALDTACANSPSFFGGKVGASVIWPEGSFKSVSAPLLISCNATIGLKGAGINATHLDTQGGGPNMGPGIVEVPVAFPPRIDPITATSLVTGSGTDFSMNWGTTGNQNNYMYNLSTVWEASGSSVNNPLNGLSAETIRFFIKPLRHGSDPNGTVYGLFRMDNSITDVHPSVKLLGTWTYGSGGTSTITICQSTTGNPAPTNSNQPPPKCITGNVTNGVVSYVEYNFDGNLHLAIGLPLGTATFVTQVASSGTLINAQNDDFWLGEAANDPIQLMSGQLDGFEVSKVVRHAQGSGSFTAPSAKYASDGNTLFLANNPSVKNINVNGVTPYVFAIKTTTGAGWLVPFGFDPPSGGGIQSIEDLTSSAGFTLNESLSNGLSVNRVDFNSGYFGGYYGWNQAYNDKFESVSFTNFNTLYQLRADGNTFGVFNNLSFSSGFYLIIGSGGGTFTNIFEQIGSGTIVANTFLGKGDLFTADFIDYLVTDAEEGGCAIPIAVGGSMAKFTIDHSVFQPAGCSSPALQIGGQPPNHTWIGNSGVFGNIQFDTFANTSRPALQSEPVILENDYTSTGAGAIGLLSSSVCAPYPFACQIVGANSQFSRLGIQVGPPQPMGISENSVGTNTVTVSKLANAMSGDAYIMTMDLLGADPSTFTIPSDWTQDAGACSVADTALGNPSVSYVRTFHHIASVADPANWTFAWSNSPIGKYLVTLVRGADQSNPIDLCFGSHNNSVTAVPLTGGTSTNINDLVLNYVGYYTGTAVGISVGATPPSDLANIRNVGSFGNTAWWYTPASLTIPTVNYVLTGSSVQWAGLQIAIRSKTQSATVLGNTASAHVMFQGMAGAKFQGLDVGCAGQATLVSGTPSTATVSNTCITAATNVIQCTDNTSVGPVGCVPSAGSLVITGPNTVTDKVSWARLQ